MLIALQTKWKMRGAIVLLCLRRPHHNPHDQILSAIRLLYLFFFAIKAKIIAAVGLLGSTKEMMTAAGLPCAIVSAGGTGSFVYTVKVPGGTEIQAGGGIFMDLL